MIKNILTNSGPRELFIKKGIEVAKSFKLDKCARTPQGFLEVPKNYYTLLRFIID